MTLVLYKAAASLIETGAYFVMYHFCTFKKKDSKPKLGVFFAFIYLLTFLLDQRLILQNFVFYGLFIVAFNGLLKYDVRASAYFAMQSFFILLMSKIFVGINALFISSHLVKIQGFFEEPQWWDNLFGLVGVTIIAATIRILLEVIKKRTGYSRRLSNPIRLVVTVAFLIAIVISISFISFLIPNWKAISQIEGLKGILFVGYYLLIFYILVLSFILIYNFVFKHRFNKVSQMADNDPLTGMLSRNAGMNFLRKAFNHAKQSGQRLTISFVDVNDLKVVNDKHGHSAGDQLLERISEIIKSNIRDTDAAMRFGGDEFIIILQGCPYYRAEEMMTQINVYLNRFNLSNELSFKMGISYGLVEYNSLRHHHVLDLIADADTEMYKNKKKTKKPH